MKCPQCKREDAHDHVTVARPLKIGDIVYRYDVNRRVYREGTLRSELIWRESWRPMKIVGETSRSWLLEHSKEKLPKKGADKRCWCLTEAELDEACWVQDHGRNILNRVEAVARADYAMLRRLAVMVDYKEGK